MKDGEGRERGKSTKENIKITEITTLRKETKEQNLVNERKRDVGKGETENGKGRDEGRNWAKLKKT